MNLEQITNVLKMQPDPVLAQKIQQQDPFQSAIAAALLKERQETRAAAAPMQPPVPQMANQPPVTQGIFPMMAQAAQQLQMQRAMAPQAGLGAVEPPIRMASGGVVALQEGGDPRDYISTAYSEAPSRYEGKSLRDIIRGLRTLIAGGGDPEFYSRAFATAPASQPSRLDVTPAVEATGTPRLRPTAPPGARPPTGIASALRTPPGAVAMTTPEMGPPRPDAGIAGVAPSNWEADIERYHAPAAPKKVTAEEALARQLELERKYGVRGAGQGLIEQMQRELAQQQEEAKTIGQRALHAAAVGGIGQPTLAGALGAMARTGYQYRESAENALKQAQIFRQQAIAKLQDAENERNRGKITDAIKSELEAEKYEREYQQKMAEAKTIRAGKESEIEQRRQEARERVTSQERIAEASNERMLEAARIQARATLAAANAGASIREGTGMATARARAVDNMLDFYKNDLEFLERLKKDRNAAMNEILLNAAKLNPDLFPELKQQGGSSQSNLPQLKPGEWRHAQ